jgi:hypothetical protein
VSWGGRQVTRLRQAWAGYLPQPCYRCGVVIRSGDPFDLEHDPPRMLGGTKVVGVSHPSCNRAAGARLGNAARSLGKVDRSW